MVIQGRHRISVWLLIRGIACTGEEDAYLHAPMTHRTQDWNTLLRMEEEYIEKMCAEIVAFHPDIVITEKGVSGAWWLCCEAWWLCGVGGGMGWMSGWMLP